MAARFRRLCRDRYGEPRLYSLKAPEAGDFVLTVEHSREVWRLIELSEGSAHRATSTDRHIARAIHGKIDRAEHVVTELDHWDGDQLIAWLARFDEAVERFERVARLG